MTQSEVFGYVIDILERLGIPYMITGSVASVAYGEPRLTLDMDVVIDMTPEQAEALAASFSPEYYADLEMMRSALKVRGHFNVIHPLSGVKVDFFVLKATPSSQGAFTRRRRDAFDAQRAASFATPEDVILGKLDYYRQGGSPKHLEDIRGILRISGSRLDLGYIDRWAAQMGVAEIWLNLKQETGRPHCKDETA